MRVKPLNSYLVDHVLAVMLFAVVVLITCFVKPWIVAHPIRAFLWATGIPRAAETWALVFANPISWHTARTLAWAYVFCLIPYVSYRAYDLFFRKMNFVGVTKDPLVNTEAVDRIKPVGGAPPPFPNSWFRAVDSIDVDEGQVLPDTICGRHIVIFRDAKDDVHILASKCPSCHKELNNGKVVGSAIECASCHSQFDGKTGQCLNNEKVANILAYHTGEANGHIYIWHHADNVAPTWNFEAPKEMNDGSWMCHGRTEHRVTAHLAEMPENGPDVAHLNYLHTDFVVPWLRWCFIHYWVGKWSCGNDEENNKHNAFVNIVQSVRFMRKHTVPGSVIHVNVTQNGPGLVFLHFRIPFGKAYVIESVTPVTPLYQKYHHICWCEWQIPRAIGKGLLRGLVAQAERDVPIWNHKTYENKPMLVTNDGPILQFRRWVKQFYSPSSVTWEQYYEPLGFTREQILGGERLPCAAFVSDASELKRSDNESLSRYFSEKPEEVLASRAKNASL